MKKLFTIFIFSVILINAIFAASKKIQLEEADKGEDLTLTVQEKSEAKSETYTYTYDITNESSFASIDFWIEELKFKVENENMILCLVGNKSDVTQDERKVSTAKAKNFAQENNMIFYETSAKTGDGIKDLFVTIANKVYEQFKK